MNSELYGKEYKIPDKILQNINSLLIRYPNSEGSKRAKFLLKNKNISYSNLKRIKNFFDNDANDIIQYELYGGDQMKTWINNLLNSERSAVHTQKEIKSDINTSTDINRGLRLNTKNITENIDEICEITEKNALVIVFNDDKKILLLKRSNDPNIWEPNKWGLIGGKIEMNEKSLDAAIRECFEETQLKLENLIHKVNIQRNSNSMEYIYISKYTGNGDDIVLNDENSNWGFFSFNEIKFLDTVHNLLEYIQIAVEDYN